MKHESDQSSNHISSSFRNKQDVKTCIVQSKKHKCTYCPAAFAKPFKLQRHIRQHTGERPYICDHPGCTKSYSSSCHLKRHLKTHSTFQTVYLCPQCRQVFRHPHNMKRHCQRQHSIDKKDKHSCGECDTTFNTKRQLLKHQTVHFGPAVYKCGKCGKSFQNFGKLSRHEKRGHQEKSYPCPVSGCLEIFNKWTLLRKHGSAKHVTEHKCDKCNKVFLSSTRLKNHLKIHSEHRPVILCSYAECCRTFFYESNLRCHIKKQHLGIKLYCDICSKGFAAKFNLIAHIKRHDQPEKKRKKTVQRKKRKDAGIPKKKK